MIEWEAPAALLLLALLPVLRWLHRFRAVRAPFPVAALFPWRGARPASAAGTLRARPDPAWRRRALLAALLVTVVAGPRWQRETAPPLDVWIDDRPSLYSVEQGESRLAAGLAEVRRLAATRDDVTLRSLSRPGIALPLAAADAWPKPPGPGPVHLPPPRGLAGDREHWLLSDGSDSTVNGWARRATPRRVIRVGAADGNQALVQLALRRDGDGLLGQAVAFNDAPRTVRRRLVVDGPGMARVEKELELGPGERRAVPFGVAAPWPGRIIAVLDGADPLADDDRMELATAALDPVTVSVDPACPALLRDALERHPGLLPKAAGGTLLEVACGATRPDGPGLWWRQGDTRRVSGSGAWTAEAGALGRLAIPPLGAAVEVADTPLPGTPWLIDDGGALVVAHDEGAPLVELRLRPADGADARWPLLVDGLLSRITGRELLDPTAGLRRAPEQARIAPRDDLPGGDGTGGSAPLREPFDPEGWLLLAALPLTLFELFRVERGA